MTTDASLWSFIFHAGTVVKIVMAILAMASIASWTIIFQRSLFLSRAKDAVRTFEKKFWSGSDLYKLYGSLDSRRRDLSGLEHIFVAGFEEFSRLNKQAATPEAIMDGAGRAMRIAVAHFAPPSPPGLSARQNSFPTRSKLQHNRPQKVQPGPASGNFFPDGAMCRLLGGNHLISW